MLLLLAGCGGGDSPKDAADGVAPLDSAKVALAVPARVDVAQAQAELAGLALDQVAFDPIATDADRDYFLTAASAKEYGLVDIILERRDDMIVPDDKKA